MEKAILEFLSEVVLSEDEKVPALSTTLISTTAEALVTSRVRVESCAVPVAASVGETGDCNGETVPATSSVKTKLAPIAAYLIFRPRIEKLRLLSFFCFNPQNRELSIRPFSILLY